MHCGPEHHTIDKGVVEEGELLLGEHVLKVKLFLLECKEN